MLYYNSNHSQYQHQVEVSGQCHFTYRRVLPVPIELEPLWGPESNWKLGRMETETLLVFSRVRSLVLHQLNCRDFDALSPGNLPQTVCVKVRRYRRRNNVFRVLQNTDQRNSSESFLVKSAFFTEFCLPVMLAVLLPRSQIASFNVHFCTWQKVGPQTHTDDVLSAVHLPLLIPQHALSNLRV